MIELWFARTWIVIVAVLSVGLVAVALWIAVIGVRQWQRENEWYNNSDHSKPHPDYNTTALIAGVVASMILWIMLAIMDVGQATALLSNDNVLNGVSWLYGAVLVPLVLGKAMNKFASSKYGSAEAPPPPPQGGGTP